jgi:hypothetical protein
MPSRSPETPSAADPRRREVIFKPAAEPVSAPVADDGLAAGDQDDDLHAVLPRRRPIALAIGAAVLVAATVMAGRALLRPPTTGSVVTQAVKPRPATSLPSLGLQVRLPEGWQRAPGPERVLPAGPDRAAVKESLVRRGGQGTGSELLLAVLPLEGPLAGRPGDEVLLSVTGRGHAGAVALLRARHVPVQSEGCRIAVVEGRRAVLCSGTAVQADKLASLRTYLIVRRANALLAILVDRSGDAGRAAEADRIVASLSGP